MHPAEIYICVLLMQPALLSAPAFPHSVRQLSANHDVSGTEANIIDLNIAVSF